MPKPHARAPRSAGARARAAEGRREADRARDAPARSSRAATRPPPRRRDAQRARRRSRARAPAARRAPASTKERLFAHPEPPGRLRRRRPAPARASSASRSTSFDGYFTERARARPATTTCSSRCSRGATVIAGTILGRIGKTDATLAPHVEFAIRPAGRGAPRIDPKPILDGWKLLESTAIYRAKGTNPFFGRDAAHPSIGQILLMSKEQLQQRVLADPHIDDLRRAGARTSEAGAIDRRVLATLEFLVRQRPEADGHARSSAATATTRRPATSPSTRAATRSTSPRSTASRSSATRATGSITDITIRRLLTLQGTMKPHQIISLMTYPGTDNTLALPDHADHIHVGFHPARQTCSAASSCRRSSSRSSGRSSSSGSASIENPVVPTHASKYAIKDGPRRLTPAARARGGRGLPLRAVRVPVGARPAGRALRRARRTRGEPAGARARARDARRAASGGGCATAARAAVAPEPPPAPVTTARATVIDARAGRARRGASAGSRRPTARRTRERRSRCSRARCAPTGSPAATRPCTSPRSRRRSSCASATAPASRSPRAAGRAARELPPPRGRAARASPALRPQERLAALLGGHARRARLRGADAARAPRPRPRAPARGGAAAARRARRRARRAAARGARLRRHGATGRRSCASCAAGGRRARRRRARRRAAGRTPPRRSRRAAAPRSGAARARRRRVSGSGRALSRLRRSAALEARRALLEEGGDALAARPREANTVANASCSAAIPASRSACAETRLICATASGACAASWLASASAVVEQLARPARRGSRARSARASSAEIGSPTRFSSSAFAGADEPRQPLRAAEAGDDPELDLGLAEARRGGGDAQVARHRQLAAAAEREAVDGRDRDDRAALEGAQQLVRAGDEGAARPPRPSP